MSVTSSRYREVFQWLALVCLGVAIAALLVEQPALAVAVSVTPFVVLTAPGRIMFVVVGGLTALGTSSELDVLKLAYLGGVAAILLVAAARYVANAQVRQSVWHLPLVQASLLLGSYFAFSLLWGMIRGNDPVMALRDAAPYGLFVLVPLLAFDGAVSPHDRMIGGFFVVVGVLATISFPLYWGERRELMEVGNAFLPAVGSLPVAFFAFLCAGSIIGKWRALWGLAAGIAFILLMLSGNRAILLVLLAPISMVLMSKGDRLSRSLRVLLSVTALIVVGVFGLRLFGSELGVDTTMIAGRFGPPRSIEAVLRDQSLEIRLSQWAVATEELTQHPVLGTGPGYTFVWVNPVTGRANLSFTMDTPMVYPAKYGIVGVILFLLLAGYYWRFFTRLPRGSIGGLALIGYSVAEFVNMLLIGSPIENKGLTFGFLLLMTLALRDYLTESHRQLGHSPPVEESFQPEAGQTWRPTP